MHLHTFAIAGMAKVATFSLIILLISFAISNIPSLNSQEFYSKVSKRPEQVTRFRFYLSESIRGEAPSSVVVTEAPTTNTYRLNFGRMVVFDDPLREGPNLSSMAVGRAQGMFVYSEVGDLAQLIVYNYVFTQGRFNGSTLNVMARDIPFLPVRELPVLSGTARLRFARGYVRIREILDDTTKGFFVNEHHVYVIFDLNR